MPNQVFFCVLILIYSAGEQPACADSQILTLFLLMSHLLMSIASLMEPGRRSSSQLVVLSCIIMQIVVQKDARAVP